MSTVLSNAKRWEVLQGDSLEVLRTFPDNSVDSVVTDPPAGISFMGSEWDSDKGGRDAWIHWLCTIMSECLRVLKPGGHVFVWAIPKHSHWTGMAIELAGFDMRDVTTHIFGSGFPHGSDVSKAIDKKMGAEPTVVGSYRVGGNALTPLAEKGGTFGVAVPNSPSGELSITEATSPEAKAWEGWCPVLKPATEHWWLAQKPLVDRVPNAKGKIVKKNLTIADCVLKWGTGALNIGGTSIKGEPYVINKLEAYSGFGQVKNPEYTSTIQKKGRWPANLCLSHTEFCGTECAEGCPVRVLNEQSGDRPSTLTGRADPNESHPTPATPGSERFIAAGGMVGGTGNVYADSGGASRFFNVFDHCDPWPHDKSTCLGGFIYAAKAPTREKDAGLDAFRKGLARNSVTSHNGTGSVRSIDKKPLSERANIHATVKNLKLMRHLVRQITPPNGVVLDPFNGSGSTGCAAVLEGMRYVGIELSAEYVAISNGRIAHWELSAVLDEPDSHTKQ